MEESFALKHHGHLSLEEQALMTAEDRKWWIKKIEEVNSDKPLAEADTKTIPTSPGRPPA